MMYESSFSNKPKSKFNIIRIGVLILIVLIAIGYIGMYERVKSKGKTFYTINVYSYGNIQTFQSDSIISQSPNYIKFVDLFGRTQSVSGETITVTGY